MIMRMVVLGFSFSSSFLIIHAKLFLLASHFSFCEITPSRVGDVI